MNQEFTGKERDSESGLDYFGARYYGSALGRFTSPDSSEVPQAIPYADLANPQSLNLYIYGGNNPVSVMDEDGHCWSWLQGFCNAIVNTWQRVDNLVTYGHLVTNAKIEDALTKDAQKAKDTFQRQEIVIDGEDTADWAVGKSNKEIVDKFKRYERAKNNGRVVGAALPLPPGVNQSEFGRNVMRWGTGDEAARARISSLTREELGSSGVTKEMAETWRDFYQAVKQHNPANPSAAGRAELMQKAADLLGGK